MTTPKHEVEAALDRLESHCGPHWRGAAEEVRRERDRWDRRWSQPESPSPR